MKFPASRIHSWAQKLSRHHVNFDRGEKMINCTNVPIAFPLSIYALVFFSLHILEVPFIRLFEEAICNQYYGTSRANLVGLQALDESYCKIASVQTRLTTVVSWKIFFDAVPGIINSFLCCNSYDNHLST